jgi:8-oxo-dGTP diphosphatase
VVDDARPAGRTRQPGDGWVDCDCGSRHWGLHGAAGLLLARRDAAGEVTHVVLQHRALWSDQGGTWGVPGGAVGADESPEQGALREAQEEAGIDPDAVHVRATHVLDHGSWRYTTVLADEAPGATLDVRPTDPESLEIAWVPLADVERRPLLPAFATAWPVLLDRLTEHPAR